MEGSLLIAYPLLNDGYFNRSVVYVTSHNDEGSFGFIMNFKTQFKLRDVRPQIMNGNFPIYEGGPVGKDQLFFLHTLGKQITDAHHIKDNIYFGGDFNQMLEMVEHGKVKQNEVRFFVGYSGWDEGQIEREIRAKSWIVNSGDNSDLLLIDQNELWKQKLEEQKQSYGIFARIGFDPSMN